MSPRIPVYESKQTLQPKLSEPLRNEAAKKYEPLNEVTQALQKTADAWQVARDTMQGTKARADHAVALAEIAAQEAQDPDYTQKEKYAQQREELTAQVLGGIDNKALRETEAIRLKMNSDIGNIKGEAISRKKEIADYQYNLDRELDSVLEGTTQAITGSELVTLGEQADKIISDAVSSGLLTKEEAFQKKQAFEHARALKDAETDPVDVASRLQAGDYDVKDKQKTLSAIKAVSDQRKVIEDIKTYERHLTGQKNVNEMIDDGSTSYAEKENFIKILEEVDGISSYDAKLAKEYLDSVYKVDAETRLESLDEMLGLLAGMESLYDKKGDKRKHKEFLREAHNFNQEVIQRRSKGLLDKAMGESLMKSTERSLDFKRKVAGSLEEIGKEGSWLRYGLANAKDDFKDKIDSTLYQQQALRDYFIETDGTDYDRESRKKAVENISKRIKEKRLNDYKNKDETDEIEKAKTASIGEIIERNGTKWKKIGEDEWEKI